MLYATRTACGSVFDRGGAGIGQFPINMKINCGGPIMGWPAAVDFVYSEIRCWRCFSDHRG